MKTIQVRALRDFSSGGQDYRCGAIVDVPAIEAAMLARRQLVSLSRLAPQPSTPVKRRYRRRDLRAED